VSINLYSPKELLASVGRRAKQRRLAYALRQIDLAAAAGVTLSTLRRFEAGQSVGLDSVVAIALALRAEDGFLALFPPVETRSLDEIMNAQKQRVRVKKPS
jgi:transcriptional regulator with XRE-family HTH domain